MPVLSIVIPTTRPDLLHQCLSTLTYRKQDILFFEGETYAEVIVYANVSNSETEDAIRKTIDNFTYGVDIKYIDNKLEWCKANSPDEANWLNANKPDEGRFHIADSWENAINHATGDYVMLIGDDDGFVVNGVDKILNVILNLNAPDVICLAAACYGHPGISGIRDGKIKLDMEWDIEGHGHPDRMLKDFFSFQRTCYAPTYICFKRSIMDELCKRLGFLRHVWHQFPDYFLFGVALYAASSAYIMREPTVIHGYAPSSSAELLLVENRIVNRWDPKPTLSPFRAQTFHNGWLETLLQLQKMYPELNRYDIDLGHFIGPYSLELSLEALYRDITQDYECVVDFFKKHDAYDKFKENISRVDRVLKARLWEDGRGETLSEWIGGYSTISQAAEYVSKLWQKKKDVLNSLK